MSTFRTLTTTAFLGFLAVTADAATLTFRAAGTVDQINGDLAPLAAIIGYTPALGDAYTAEYSFSSTAVDEFPEADAGSYTLDHFAVTVGPASLVFDDGFIFIQNDYPDESLGTYTDLYNPRGMMQLAGGCSCEMLLTSVYMEWTSASPGGPLDSDALPLLPPLPGSADFANMKLSFLGDAASSGIVADIDSITVVPLPAVGWILGPAFGAVAWARRKAAS